MRNSQLLGLLNGDSELHYRKLYSKKIHEKHFERSDYVNSLDCKVVKAFATTGNLFVSECGTDVYLACTACYNQSGFLVSFLPNLSRDWRFCEIPSLVNVKMTLICEELLEF